MLVNRTCEKFVLSRLMAVTLQSALFPAPKGCVTSSKSQWVRFVFLPPSICRLFRCIDFRGWCWLKGHVEMTETMRQCLELLLAPPTRFTSVLVIVHTGHDSHFMSQVYHGSAAAVAAESVTLSIRQPIFVAVSKASSATGVRTKHWQFDVF